MNVHEERNIFNLNTAPQSAPALAEASQEKDRAQIVAGERIINILEFEYHYIEQVP